MLLQDLLHVSVQRAVWAEASSPHVSISHSALKPQALLTVQSCCRDSLRVRAQSRQRIGCFAVDEDYEAAGDRSNFVRRVAISQ